MLEALEGVLCSCTTFHVSTNSGFYTVNQPGEADDRDEVVAAVPEQQQPSTGVLVPAAASSSTTDKVSCWIDTGGVAHKHHVCTCSTLD